MTTSKPALALLPSYLAMIENSVGANLFRKLFFRIGDETIDVLEDGDLSCAVYVSSILYWFRLIDEQHATVTAAVDDLRKSGWYEIREPRAGAIILWSFEKKDDGTQGTHRHLGFYIDSENAISNNSDTRVIARHHPTFGAFENGEVRREIQAYFWNDALDEA